MDARGSSRSDPAPQPPPGDAAAQGGPLVPAPAASSSDRAERAERAAHDPPDGTAGGVVTERRAEGTPDHGGHGGHGDSNHPGGGGPQATTEVAANATQGTGQPGAKKRRRIPREVRITLSTIVLIFVVEYFLLPEISRARKNIHLLEQVNPLWLIIATGLEVLSLLAYAQLTYTVLSPGAPKRFRLFRINMWSLAVSHVLPGGTAAGTAASYRMLTESGVPGNTAAFGLAFQGVGSAVVLNLIFWVALVISIPIHGFNPLYGTAAIVGTLLFAAFGGSALALTKGKRASVDWLHRAATHVPFVNPDKVTALVQHVADRLELLLRDRHLLSRALIWAAANWLLDAASLWVFLIAFGHTVFPVDLLVAYGLANILAAIPVTPGGLGVIETASVAALTGFGVPGRVAFVAVLTWRLVNFWLPIPAGGVAYLSLRFGPHGRRTHHPAHPVDTPGGTAVT